jgi:hypothetical protein
MLQWPPAHNSKNHGPTNSAKVTKYYMEVISIYIIPVQPSMVASGLLLTVEFQFILGVLNCAISLFGAFLGPWVRPEVTQIYCGIAGSSLIIQPLCF